MKNDQVKLLYDEMSQMSCDLPMEAELGMRFYRERLPQIRRYHDRLTQMSLVSNQDASRIGRSIRVIKASLAALTTDHSEDHRAEVASLRQELEGLEQESIDIRYLADTVEAMKGNVRQAGMDIRLMLKSIETERALGEVTPPSDGERPRLPGGVETTPADRADW